MSAVLATLPMQLVCQLIITGSPNISEPNFALPATPAPSPVTTCPPPPPVTECPPPPPPVICPTGPTITKPTTLPEGYTAYSKIGVAYKYHNIRVPWNEARKVCISEGAQLALIDSIPKLVYASVTGFNVNHENIHVGIHSLYNYGDWVNVRDGASVTSIPWDFAEPSGGYQCVMIKYPGLGVGNYGCDTKEHFICEILLSGDHEVEVPKPKTTEIPTTSEDESSSISSSPWPWDLTRR